MLTVHLVDDPQAHEFNHQQSSKIQPDCDCACPIESDALALPTLDMPTFYSLELTPSCNNRCPGCSNVFFEDVPNRIQLTPARPPLPLEKWQKILQTISPYASRLKITGGEATLHPHFEQIIDDIEQRDILFTLFTNARWQNPARTIQFLQTKKRCAGLLISLHGATAQAHEAFTGIPNSFAETVTNIKQATQTGLSIHISCVFTAYNLNQIKDLVILANKLGAKATVFNRYIGQAVKHIKINPAQLAYATKQVDKLIETGHNVRFGTCIPLCFVESNATGCSAGTAYCTIDPWGNMRPCNHTPWLTGNILTDSLQQAWQSTTMNQFRQLIPDSGCTSCASFSICRGGCRADAILNNATKDPLMTKPSIIPLKTKQIKVSHQNLYRHAKINFTCKIRKQEFGHLLIQGNHLLPLTEQLTPILEASTTNKTLQDIHNQSTLNLIGELYQQGFLSLTW